MHVGVTVKLGELSVQIKYLWSVTCILLQEKANQVWETKQQARTTTTTTTLFIPYIDLHDTKKNTIKYGDTTGYP